MGQRSILFRLSAQDLKDYSQYSSYIVPASYQC